MLVFWKQKLILFALPKTGTTALEAALSPTADISILNPPGLKHCTVQKYEREFAHAFERGGTPLTRMALVREPMEWLRSWYRYRSRPEIQGRENAVPGLSFSDFVQEWLKDKPAPFARIGTQSKFLTNKDGRIGIDHLFKYENFTQAHDFLEHRLERKITLEARNISTTAPVEIEPELRAQVIERRPREFAVWEMGAG